MYNRKWSLFLASLVAQSYLWCVYISYIYICVCVHFTGEQVCAARVLYITSWSVSVSALPQSTICMRVDIVCTHTTHTHTHTPH